MKRYVFILAVISITLFNGCEALFSCLEGNGELSKETRAVSGFTGIYATADFNVEVVFGAKTLIEVEADDNLQQYIRTYVRGSDLMIEVDQERCLDSQNPINIMVTTPNLQKLINSGSGNIDIYDFSVTDMSITLSGSGDIDIYNLSVSEDLDLTNTGSGDISAEGKALNGRYILSGSGDIIADDLKLNSCDIILSGSGSIDAYIVEFLEVTLSGSGDVNYFGDPDIRSRITGSGKVIQL